MAVTRFPRTYFPPSPDVVYLDTRGFLDTRGDHASDSAALILLEMALSKAASIRFVMIDQYETIAGGAVHYQSIGQILRKIISDVNNAPILFVYNRFLCPDGVKCPKREPNRTDFIMNRIKEQLHKMHTAMVNDIADIVRDANDAIAQGPDRGRDRSQLDNSIEHLQREYEYVHILQSNFDAGRAVYLDPTSESSISSLRQKIRDLEPISRDKFDFFATADAQQMLNEDLPNVIGPLDAILAAHVDSLRFPDSVLRACNDTIHKRITKGERSLEVLASPDKANADELRKIKEEYNVTSSAELRRRIRALTDRRRELEVEIESIQNKTEEVFNCSWDQEAGFALTHKHRCTYAKGIPYFQIVEKLGTGTSRKDHSVTETEFDVTYTSANATQTLEEFGETVLSAAKYALEMMESGVVQPSPLPKDGSLRDQVVAKLIANPTAVGVGTLAGTTTGFLQSVFWSRACTGQVQLIAHVADIPALNRSLQEKIDQKEWCTKSLGEVQTDLKRVLEHEHGDVKHIINDALDMERGKEKNLTDVKVLRELAAGQYSTHKLEIQAYGNLLLRLPNRGPAILGQFRRHWALVNRVERVRFDSCNAEKVHETVDAVGDATNDRRTQFARWGLPGGVLPNG
jgi:hypothetical protein